MRDVCKMYEIFKFLLHQYFLRVITKLECTSVAGDSVEFTNLIVFWIKFVPLEMKTFVNIENSLWMVIIPYPRYINDSNSLSMFSSF